VLETRKKHGITLKYLDVQASTATMNKHRHSRCHYKRNSGSTPAGMNNLHIGGPAGRQTPGGSPPTTTAAAMTSGQTLLRQGPRPRPHSRGEDKPPRPKSRRSVRGWRRRSRRRRNLLRLPPPQHRRQAATCPPTDPHSSPPGRASTDLRAEALCRSKDETTQEHERRPSGVRRLGRSTGAHDATAARTADR
jgi:hypothetical protein